MTATATSAQEMLAERAAQHGFQISFRQVKSAEQAYPWNGVNFHFNFNTGKRFSTGGNGGGNLDQLALRLIQSLQTQRLLGPRADHEVEGAHEHFQAICARKGWTYTIEQPKAPGFRDQESWVECQACKERGGQLIALEISHGADREEACERMLYVLDMTGYKA